MIVNPGQVAIFYATESNILLSKIVLMPNDIAHAITTPPGQSILIILASEEYHDEACYQLISQKTGKPPLNRNSDRCVVIGHDRKVAAVHKRDPAIFPVQEHEHHVVLHPDAEIGDHWVEGTTFHKSS